MKPLRIQLSRAKGWRMPPNTVKIDRSTKFGNPFRSDQPPPEALAPGGPATAAEAYRLWLEGSLFQGQYAERRQVILDSLHELRGKNLACWCGPYDPCHGDPLLELANR